MVEAVRDAAVDDGVANVATMLEHGESPTTFRFTSACRGVRQRRLEAILLVVGERHALRTLGEPRGSGRPKLAARGCR